MRRKTPKRPKGGNHDRFPLGVRTAHGVRRPHDHRRNVGILARSSAHRSASEPNRAEVVSLQLATALRLSRV